MYNAEKFISKCLLHLIHQTYKDLEIIIVDDGSTDKSVACVQQFAKSDKRIKIIRQENAGPSVASNTGLAAANGKYIHFHDHDDWVNLDYFEIMARAINETDADILCGQVNQPEYNFPSFDAIEICTTMSEKFLKTAAHKLNPAWRYVYKKSFLDRTGLKFEPALFGIQDVFFTKPALVLAKTVATVPGAVYNVNNTPTALGKSQHKIAKSCTSDAAVAAINRYNEFMQQHNVCELLALPEFPLESHEFRIFNIKLARRDIFKNKIRYYLFGINIGTSKIIK